jgi:hypothetical protein
MAIKMNKRYKQTAHYVPTQATPWAIDNLNRDANVEHTEGMMAAHAARTQEAVTNQHHAPGGMGRDRFGFDTRPQPEPVNHGGGLVQRSPGRDAELHRKNPGLMDRWLQQGSRSDGGNS